MVREQKLGESDTVFSGAKYGRRSVKDAGRGLLLDYFIVRGPELAFPFTRQTLHSYASEAFACLTYGIDPQLVHGAKVPAHERNAGVHFLRHLRASELASFYGFEPAHLAYYCGWDLRSAGLSKVMARYISLSWQSYFARLLLERA